MFPIFIFCDIFDQSSIANQLKPLYQKFKMRLLAPIILFIALTTALPTPEKSGDASHTGGVTAAGDSQEPSMGTTHNVVADASKDQEPELGLESSESKPPAVKSCILQEDLSASGLSARTPVSKGLFRLFVIGYTAQNAGAALFWKHRLQQLNTEKEKKIVQAIEEKGSNEVTANVAIGKNDDRKTVLQSISEILGAQCVWKPKGGTS